MNENANPVVQGESVSIRDIEQAINYWRSQEPAHGVALGIHARSLADVYGLMIFNRHNEVAASELNETQIEAISIAKGNSNEHN